MAPLCDVGWRYARGLRVRPSERFGHIVVGPPFKAATLRPRNRWPTANDGYVTPLAIRLHTTSPSTSGNQIEHHDSGETSAVWEIPCSPLAAVTTSCPAPAARTQGGAARIVVDHQDLATRQRPPSLAESGWGTTDQAERIAPLWGLAAALPPQLPANEDLLRPGPAVEILSGRQREHRAWQIFSWYSASWRSRWRCSADLALERYDRLSRHPPRRVDPGLHLLGDRHVQAGVVLNGLFLTILTLVIALVSPGGTWAPTWQPSSTVAPLPAMGERPIYRALAPDPTTSSRGNATALAGHLLLGGHRPDVSAHPDPGVPAAQPAAPRGGQAALSFNTAVSFVTNTNGRTTAGIDDVVLLADRCPHRRTVRQSCGGHSGGHRVGARLSRRNSPTIGNFWVDVTAACSTSSFPWPLWPDHLRR